MKTDTELGTELISPKQLADLQTSVSPVLSRIESEVRDLVIDNPHRYQTADTLLTRIRDARSKISAEFDPIILPIRRGLDKLYELRRKLEAPLGLSESEVRSKMVVYKTEERIQAEQERYLAQAETRRLENEVRRKSQEEARAKEEARQAELMAERSRMAMELEQRSKERQEFNRRRTEALQLEAVVRQREADRSAKASKDAEMDLLAAQASLSGIVNQPKVKAQGSTTRTVTTWDVVDLSTLIQAVADGKVPMTILQVDGATMDQYWRADRGMVEGWPGIGTKDVVTIVGKGRR